MKLACYDCGLLYSSNAWCDVAVSNEVWLKISPTGHHGGVLCFNCMTKRIVELGLENVEAMITSGPWKIKHEDCS